MSGFDRRFRETVLVGDFNNAVLVSGFRGRFGEGGFSERFW